MTETGWQAIGRIARLRRERLGLKQEDLARYGGPKVSTVGKFERAAQDNFPLRTQHQMETALGWSRTIIEQVVRWVDEGRPAEDWEHDLIEEDIPDLGRPLVDDPLPEPRLEFLMTLFRLVPEERRDDALRAVVYAIGSFIAHDDPGPYAAREAVSAQADRPDLALAADPGDDAAGETESYHET